jgi:hypothetical protein
MKKDGSGTVTVRQLSASTRLLESSLPKNKSVQYDYKPQVFGGGSITLSKSQAKKK